VLPFLYYLNSKHPNIQFTYEFENNSSLPFLDVTYNVFKRVIHDLCRSHAKALQLAYSQTLIALFL
jgi:hypothetical protein